MNQYSTKTDKNITPETGAKQTDPRLIGEAGKMAHIASVIEPVIEDMGYQLVSVFTEEHAHKRLVIMVDRYEGGLTLNDCEMLTHALSPIIDTQDPIENHYFLEISSPGTNRPLVRQSDFAKRIGKNIRIEMRTPIEGRKNFRGIIQNVETDHVILTLVEKRKTQDPDNLTMRLPLHDMAKANLVDTNIIELLKTHQYLKKNEKKKRIHKNHEQKHGENL